MRSPRERGRETQREGGRERRERSTAMLLNKGILLKIPMEFPFLKVHTPVAQ